MNYDTFEHIASYLDARSCARLACVHPSLHRLTIQATRARWRNEFVRVSRVYRDVLSLDRIIYGPYVHLELENLVWSDILEYIMPSYLPTYTANNQPSDYWTKHCWILYAILCMYESPLAFGELGDKYDPGTMSLVRNRFCTDFYIDLIIVYKVFMKVPLAELRHEALTKENPFPV